MAGSVDGVNGAAPSYGTNYIVDGITTDQQEKYSDGEVNTGEKIGEIGQYLGACVAVFNPALGAAVVALTKVIEKFAGLSGGKGKG